MWEIDMRKIIIGLAPLLLATGGAAIAAPGAWSVSEVSGTVRLNENGKSRAAVRGALLSSGATIVTGPGSRAVIVRGQEFVIISPQTQLRVPVAAQSRGGIMQMIADFGTAVFNIKKKSTPHFGVQTPYLAAVVKGTTFTVTIGPEGGSVQVTEGLVEVSTLDGGAAELITPGKIAQVGASDLYRLNVDGGVSRSTRSGNAPAVGSAASRAKPAAYAGPAGGSIVITGAVGEDRLDLANATNGLVNAEPAVNHATAEFADQARTSKAKPAKPGNDPGKEDKPGKDGKDGNDDRATDPEKDKDKDKDKDRDRDKDKDKDKGRDKAKTAATTLVLATARPRSRGAAAMAAIRRPVRVSLAAMRAR